MLRIDSQLWIKKKNAGLSHSVSPSLSESHVPPWNIQTTSLTWPPPHSHSSLCLLVPKPIIHIEMAPLQQSLTNDSYSWSGLCGACLLPIVGSFPIRWLSQCVSGQGTAQHSTDLKKDRHLLCEGVSHGGDFWLERNQFHFSGADVGIASHCVNV